MSWWYKLLDDFSRVQMARADCVMSTGLQRRAKRRSHIHSAGSSRGLTENGALRLNSDLNAFHAAPGTVNGNTWLGLTKPQLACEQPMPNSPRSMIVTSRPVLRK